MAKNTNQINEKDAKVDTESDSDTSINTNPNTNNNSDSNKDSDKVTTDTNQAQDESTQISDNEQQEGSTAKGDTSGSGSELESESETGSHDGDGAEEKVVELSKDDILKILKTFPGVGHVIAERIYEAGFDSREKLQAISIEALKEIPGIGHALAENIISGMDNAIKKFDTPVVEEKKSEGPGVTDKAMGFIKGTISKITGFFKGKQPKPVGKDKGTDELGVTGEIDKPGDKTPVIGIEDATGGDKDSDNYYPEVGAPAGGKEQTPDQAPDQAAEKLPEANQETVSIEASDTEPSSELLLHTEKGDSTGTGTGIGAGTETSSGEMAKEESPVGKIMPPAVSQINFTESSGLFVWFENTPNLRSEAGKLLFKAGYNNLEELREAVVEDLVLVNGINDEEARIICQELQKL